MKAQSGDAENWNRTVRNLREVDRLEEFAKKQARRSDDPKTNADRQQRRADRLAEKMLLKVLGWSALFWIGVAFSALFFATGGDFNLIEWFKEI
jgi:hypothetical protein